MYNYDLGVGRAGVENESNVVKNERPYTGVRPYHGDHNHYDRTDAKNLGDQYYANDEDDGKCDPIRKWSIK